MTNCRIVKPELTASMIEHHKREIDKLSQIEMAQLLRFSKPGHIYFDSTQPLAEYFAKRFREKGGMTSRISQDIGWG